jgi:hypothetical protein
MKNIFIILAFLALGSLIFSGCEYKYDDYEDPVVYIPQSGYSAHTFLKSDTTYSLSVYLAGVRDNKENIVTRLTLATAEFNTFNAANNNKYTLLPSSAYKIIEAGEAVTGYVFTLAEAEQNAKMRITNPSVPVLHYIDASTTKVVGDGYEVFIPKESSRGNLTFTVYGAKLETGKEYILPVKIVDVSKYRVNEDKTVALFGIKLK